jgi:hypothetical protein
LEDPKEAEEKAKNIIRQGKNKGSKARSEG